jgi:hypothetical protein
MVERLREIPHVRQISGEPRRRWFVSEFLELMVWVNGANRPIKFQFCHRSGDSEYAFTWHEKKGWDYTAVDTGDSGGVGIKASAILRSRSAPDLVLLRSLFAAAAGDIPKNIQRFILNGFTPPRRRKTISKKGKSPKMSKPSKKSKSAKKVRSAKKSKSRVAKKAKRRKTSRVRK